MDHGAHSCAFAFVLTLCSPVVDRIFRLSHRRPADFLQHQRRHLNQRPISSQIYQYRHSSSRQVELYRHHSQGKQEGYSAPPALLSLVKQGACLAPLTPPSQGKEERCLALVRPSLRRAAACLAGPALSNSLSNPEASSVVLPRANLHYCKSTRWSTERQFSGVFVSGLLL